MTAYTIYSGRWITNLKQRERINRETLAVMEKGYGLTPISEFRGAVYFTDGRCRLWAVSDNGGELNVGLVNHDETMRSVAYTAWRLPLDGGTMAYRIAMVVQDWPINYDLRAEDMYEVLVAA